MKDKRLRDKFYNTSDQELRFTKEDRNEVFEQIHTLEKKNNTKKNSLVSSSKKFAPLTVSLLVVSLCIFLFIPSIFPENSNLEAQLSTKSGNLQVAGVTNDFPIYSKDELNQTGYKGTKQDVIMELMEYSHLIPYESLNGKMDFIPEDAQILTHEWALMPFGDGSTGGYLLLKFRVDENGHYPSNVEVVDSYLYGEGFK